MRWRDERRSSNIEDRRGMPGGFGRGGGGLPIGGRGGVGVVGLLAILGISYFLGIDPRILLEGVSNGGGVVTQQEAPSRSPRGSQTATNDEMKDFVAAVLGSTEDTWRKIMPQLGRQYQDPTLVLFSGAVQSACGFAQAAMGPFYCPADQKVYIDLSFYRDLKNKLGAPGEFAQAYVIAHEIGHHVQTLLGITQKVNSLRGRLSPEQQNQISVMTELQADCLAGVWAYNANLNTNLLEDGDVEQGLNAAAAIGDDRLQKQAQGYVVPESFTHGSSAQRVRWFRRGLETGDPKQCDTFNASSL
jgi:predicted metalloprotease